MVDCRDEDGVECHGSGRGYDVRSLPALQERASYRGCMFCGGLAYLTPFPYTSQDYGKLICAMCLDRLVDAYGIVAVGAKI